MGSYALIADADRSRTALYAGFVRDAGLEAVIAEDGKQAIKALDERGRPALLITELSLPKVDGFELLRNVAGRGFQPRAPVLVVSAFLALRSKAEQLKEPLGITAMVPRTLPAATLHRMIQDAIQGRLDAAARAAAPATPRPAAVAPVAVATKAPVSDPAREARRLQQLSALGIVDDQIPDEALQRLVRETAAAFGVPVALVSVVLEDRQWFKAHVGLSGQLLKDRGTPREWAFCHHVVDAQAPLVIPDAARHPYFADNPLVKQGAVRGYAGVPLKTASGLVLGTLCVVDDKPLSLGRPELESLGLLARRVAGEIELGLARRRRSQTAGRELAMLGAVLAGLDEGIALFDPQGRAIFVNDALLNLTGLARQAIVGAGWRELVAALAAHARDAAELRERMRVPESGAYAANDEVELARPERRVLSWKAVPLDEAAGGGQLTVLRDVTAERELAELRGG